MNTNACEPENAQAYLKGEFTPAHEQEYLDHLDGCASCREHLEVVAGGKELLTELQAFLAEQPPTAIEKTATTEDDRTDLPDSIQQVVKALRPTDEPASLGRLDSFEVKGVVGHGAMGIVLKAKDPSLDRVVALKVMNPALAASGAARTRFEREAKAAAAVHHPNVVSIHGVLTSADLPYLVMPYLKGGSLQQRVDDQGPFSLTEILRIGSQIAAGLAAAHQQGVVHRDIKPSNIMLDDGVEAAVITDFGLARIVDDATMTRTGVISGTPEFMSPEQARGDAIDGKSDIFSLGSLLYMLCTGYAPFRAQTSFGVLRRITDEAPKPIRQLNPEIPAWLCAILEDFHQKRADARPTAAQAQATLEACLAHVYQPDAVALPAKYQNTSAKSFLFRPASTGAFVMLATVTVFLALSFLHDGDNAQSKQPSDFMPTKIGGAALETKPVETKTSVRPGLYEKVFQLSFADPDAVRKLEVDMPCGTIKVNGHDSDQVVVKLSVPNLERMKTVETNGLKPVRPQNLDFDIEPNGNYIKVDSNSRRYKTNLEILVPFNTNLDLDSYDDAIEVRNVSGKVRARSQRDHITLTGVSGPVDLRSPQGNISVSLTAQATPAGSTLETYNGSIDLFVPSDLKATFRYMSQFGQVLTDLDLSTSDGTVKKAASDSGSLKIEFEKFVTSTLNGGGAELTLETTNGNIRLRQLK